MQKISLSVLALAAVSSSSAVAADGFRPAMETFLNEEIGAWANSPVLVEAISSQNTRTARYSDSEVEALDQAWRAEVGRSETPTITPVLTNAAADFLREQVEASGGRITEVFIMDARGLNVAASQVTSDYWQGDEDKHSETYGAGPGAVHFSDLELDESTQRYQGQISLTIVDPDSGEPVGAMTVGVDANSLM